MLFVATSINYMDRQVIAILKPTLEHSIAMTDGKLRLHCGTRSRLPTRSACWLPGG